MKLLLTLATIAVMASTSAFAGYRQVFINGQLYQVWENDNYSQVYRPNGYNAQGWRSASDFFGSQEP